jgi:hypothetical protein
VSGATIGGVIGAVIGSFIPGVGTSIGWMIGSAIGGYVDPEIIKGPKLGDAQAVIVREGSLIPFGYGTFVCGGNILQCGPLDEHKHRERTGKGGPVQETFSYTRTFAVGICEGSVGGVLRIWADGKLLYDARDPAEWPDDADAIRQMATDTAKFASGFTFHDGSETQSPDPALEALDESWGGGVGNVPAYRGLSYIVFRDYDCTDRSGAVPQFRFEVACCGTTTTTAHDAPWVHGYTGTTQSIFGAAVSRSIVITSGWNNNLRRSTDGGKTWGALDYSSLGWNIAAPLEVFGGAGTYYLCTSNAIAVSHDNGSSWDYVQAPLSTINILIGQPGIGAAAGDYWAPATSATTTVFPVLSIDPTDIVTAGANGQATCVGDILGNLVIGTSSGKIVTALGGVLYSGGGDIKSIASHGDMVLACIGTGGYVYSTNAGSTWTTVSGATVYGIVYAQGAWYRALIDQVQVSLDGITWRTIDTFFQANTSGSLIVTDGQSVAAFGIDGDVAALPTAYAIPDVGGWFTDLYGNIVGASTITTSACQADLADVVADFCDRVGIPSTRYDVTALSGTPVRGFLVGSLNSAGDNIRALQQGFFFDFPEWGNYPDTFTKIRAVPRGGATAFTVTEDDFIWSDEDQDVRPQAVEFPRKLHLTTADVYADYNTTTQTAERETQNVKAVGEASVDLALATTRDEAAQIADKALKVLWTQAEGALERELPEDFSRYVPSDCFSFNGKRYLLLSSESGDGTVKIKAARDRPSAYVSTATGATRIHPPPPQLGLRGPTVFSALNLPSLRTQDSTTGMYVFVCGLLNGWQGCDLQLSTDDGATYRSVATITAENTMGDLTATCGTSGDITTRVYHNHTLDSVTDAQLAARANAFAIESGGVAEIGQFKNAVDTANPGEFTLSTNTRAELGTTAAAHGVGDTFVLLDHLNFVPLDVSLAGKTLYFRPVSLGTVPANNDSYAVVFQPMFTSAPAIDFLETTGGDVIRTLAGDYLQVTA